jgi:hypothetical protein
MPHTFRSRSQAKPSVLTCAVIERARACPALSDASCQLEPTTDAPIMHASCTTGGATWAPTEGAGPRGNNGCAQPKVLFLTGRDRLGRRPGHPAGSRPVSRRPPQPKVPARAWRRHQAEHPDVGVLDVQLPARPALDRRDAPQILLNRRLKFGRRLVRSSNADGAARRARSRPGHDGCILRRPPCDPGLDGGLTRRMRMILSRPDSRRRT